VFAPPRGAPAGWYPDPYGAPYARYFDGYRWTPHVAHGTPRAEEPHPELPFPFVIGAIPILVASLITSNELLDALVDRDWNVVVYMALAVVIGYGPSVAWMWFASKRWGTGHVFSDLGVRFRPVDLGWGPLVWLGCVVGAGVVVAIIRALDVPFRGNLDTEGGGFDRDNTTIVAVVVAAVVCAPVVEEALFRGAVMRGLLSRIHAVPAIAIQAVLFGAAHVQPAFGRENVGLVITLSVLGAGFGVGTYLTRRLAPAMIAHAIWNGIAIIVLLNE
jgi:uncharacterized protein